MTRPRDRNIARPWSASTSSLDVNALARVELAGVEPRLPAQAASQTSSWSIGPSTHKVSVAIAATFCWHVMFGKREDGQYRAQVDRKNERGVEHLLEWHGENEGADEEMIWRVR
jgi:hypothetical protein